jgi:hypothetical protein
MPRSPLLNKKRENDNRSILTFRVVAVAALVYLCSVLLVSQPRSVAAGSSSGIQNSSITAQFIQGSTLRTSHFYILVSATETTTGNSGPLPPPPPPPGNVQVSVSVTVNGTSENGGNCNLNFGSNTYSQCSVTVPTIGFGTYSFSAVLANPPNNVLASAGPYEIVLNQEGTSILVTTVSTNAGSTTSSLATTTITSIVSKTSTSASTSFLTSQTSSTGSQSSSASNSTYSASSTLSNSSLKSNADSSVNAFKVPDPSLLMTLGVLVMAIAVGLLFFSKK